MCFALPGRHDPHPIAVAPLLAPAGGQRHDGEKGEVTGHRVDRRSDRATAR